MTIKKFNISKPRKYTDKQGNEKTQWNNIGQITEFHKDGGQVSRIIEIPAIGLEASIFPIEPKNAPASPASEEVPTINIDAEITEADLPF